MLADRDLKDDILENICIWIGKPSKWKPFKAQWNDLSWSVFSFYDRPEAHIEVRDFYDGLIKIMPQKCPDQLVGLSFWKYEFLLIFSRRKALIFKTTHFE